MSCSRNRAGGSTVPSAASSRRSSRCQTTQLHRAVQRDEDPEQRLALRDGQRATRQRVEGPGQSGEQLGLGQQRTGRLLRDLPDQCDLRDGADLGAGCPQHPLQPQHLTQQPLVSRCLVERALLELAQDSVQRTGVQHRDEHRLTDRHTTTVRPTTDSPDRRKVL